MVFFLGQKACRSREKTVHPKLGVSYLYSIECVELGGFFIEFFIFHCTLVYVLPFVTSLWLRLRTLKALILDLIIFYTRSMRKLKASLSKSKGIRV